MSEKSFGTMNAGIAGDRVESLVIEHATRTALINGDRVKLTPTDFALLSALAARPGEVVPRKHLAQEAFGGPMAPHDLNWRIWRLRKLAGDLEREDTDRMIGTRWGQGYILNVQGAVTTVERLEAEEEVVPLPSVRPPEDEHLTEEPVQGTLVDLTEEPITQKALTPPAAPVVADPIAARRRYIRPKSVLVASAIATAALASSWSAGYLLAGGRGSEDGSPEVSLQQDLQAPVDPPEPAADSKVPERKNNKKHPKDKKRAKNRRENRGADGNGSAVLAAPPTSSGSAGGTAPAPAQPKPDKKTSNDGGSQAAPALPAAPTRYLYHLVHPETGDHFVTTDSNTASEHQAKGYQGSAIARVYTSQESGTRALTTNHGTAWIFISNSPRTEPASHPVPIWYSTNNAGDFFYTTSESEARASGWSASLAGYARAL